MAQRLRDRAGHATGVASEVLAATAMLAQDRAWLGAAEKRIAAGAPAVRATVRPPLRSSSTCSPRWVG